MADGRAAVELHPGNVKAAFRAAKAAAQLGKHDEVLHMCSIGLQSAYPMRHVHASRVRASDIGILSTRECR